MTMSKTIIAAAGLVAALGTLGAAAYKLPDVLPATARDLGEVRLAVNDLKTRTDKLQTQVNLQDFNLLLAQSKLGPLPILDQRRLCILAKQLEFPLSQVPGC